MPIQLTQYLFPVDVRSVLLLIVVGIFLKVLWSRRKLYALGYRLPGPFAYPILGNVIQMRSFTTPEQIIIPLNEMKKEFGDIWRLWLGPYLVVVLSEAEDYESILTSKATSWKGEAYKILKIGLGGGLMTLSGNEWKKRRNIINPSFSIKTTRSFQSLQDKHARYFVQSLNEECDKGFVDVTTYAMRYSGDVICGAVFDWNTRFYEGNNDRILRLTPCGVEFTFERANKIWMKSDMMYSLTKNGKNFMTYMLQYHSFYDEAIKERAEKILKSRTVPVNDVADQNKLDEEPPDEFEDAQRTKAGKNKSMFHILLDSVATGCLTVDDICDEFNNMYNPGMDTVYTQISSFLLMMGMHKRCQDLLWQEIKDLYGEDRDAEVTVDHFSKLPYLDMCYKETMRLFTTGVLQMRHIHTDFYLTSRNITLPAGTELILSTYLLHTNSKYWKNPKSFIPERFLPEEVAKRPNYCYVPFSAGQRNCIGQTLGFDAMKTVAVHLIRNFEFFSDLKLEELPLKADISIRSAVGYNLKITRRQFEP